MRILTALLLLAVPVAYGQEAFEGKWRMDAKKSPSGKFAPVDLEQEIDVDGANVVVKSKYREPESGLYPLLWIGIMTQDLKLSGDGAETINYIGPFVHKSKTKFDAGKMTTDFTASLEQGGVTGQWIRTLSSDGKEMTLQILAKASDGRNADLTLVFKKK